MAFAEKRKQVMFAKAEHLDIADDDHLIISDIKERPVQEPVCAHAVAACQKPQRAIDSIWSILEAVPCGIFADLGQDRPNLFNHSQLV